MGKRKILFTLFIFILILLGLSIFLFKKNNSKSDKTYVPQVKSVVGPYVEVTVDEYGFRPANARVKLQGVVHFINTTSKTIEIVSTGSNSFIVAPLLPNRTTISFVLNKTGKYQYFKKDEPFKKGSIAVE
ncbi:MAG: hypothetical protein ACM3IJ_01820 [Candidatus Levyibacteriota bacterium]